MKITHVVSAIIRREDQILMINQPDEDGLYWFIPGGVIEPGELIADALHREVREETGLTLSGNMRLAFVTQVDSVYDAHQIIAFIFDISEFNGELVPDDPDQLIHDAVFVEIEDAIQRLKRVTWASMRDPLVAYLRGEVSVGTIWQYKQLNLREFELMHTTG